MHLAGKRFTGYCFYTKVANGVESNYKQQNRSLVDLETMKEIIIREKLKAGRR